MCGKLVNLLAGCLMTNAIATGYSVVDILNHNSSATTNHGWNITGCDPTMTAAEVGNKRRRITTNKLCSDLNPNDKRPYGSANLCP